MGVPLSHARRPLVLLAASYCLLLALLKSWGAFEASPDERRPRRSIPSTLDAQVVSPCVETRLGDRLVAQTASGDRVDVYLPAKYCDGEAALPGDSLRFEGKLRPPRPALMPGDFDEAELLEARGGKILAKVGAEGVYSAALTEQRLGVAIKVEDGDMRCLAPALLAVLDQLAPGAAPVSESHREPPIRNSVGAVVGRLVATVNLERPT